MVTRPTYIKGEEFVRKILAGERDFSGITLEKFFDLAGHEGFGDMQEYLRKTDLQTSPLILDDSELQYIKARGLYLPFVRGKEANLRGADLRGANLCGAHLGGAYLCGAHLGGAYLCGAHLWEANLGGADLRGADLGEANLGEANLRGAYLGGAYLGMADLRGAKNPEATLAIEYADFYKTKVTDREKAIIEEALKRKQLFVVE